MNVSDHPLWAGIEHYVAWEEIRNLILVTRTNSPAPLTAPTSLSRTSPFSCRPHRSQTAHPAHIKQRPRTHGYNYPTCTRPFFPLFLPLTDHSPGLVLEREGGVALVATGKWRPLNAFNAAAQLPSDIPVVILSFL